MPDFLFRGSLRELDPDVYELMQVEAERQFRKLILIASESTAPLAVREAMGSAFQNIYAEGYPDDETRFMSEKEILDYEARLGHYRRYGDPRYYKGVEYADTVEALARRRCAELFATKDVPADQIYVNVQALSGAPANNAVYHALVEPGAVVMGMDLLHGGHLTHGSAANRSGKYYKIVPYTINPQTEKIDMDEVERLAKEHRPKMIIVGYSSYPWAGDFKRFRQIADSVGAYLMADMAHVAGLIAAGVYPSPLPHAHVVTSTTHKTLRGPRGGIIVAQDPSEELVKKLQSIVFPGIQGGPLMHVIAAKAVAFKEALEPEFKSYQAQVVKNAQAMATTMIARGYRIVSGGTQNHLFLVDMIGKDVSGKDAEAALGRAHITVNKNAVPGDPRSPFVTSGLRLGTPAVTTRGYLEPDCVALANWICDVLDNPADDNVIAGVRENVTKQCARFPVYG